MIPAVATETISEGKVVRWMPTGAVGVIKEARSRSSKVEFRLASIDSLIAGCYGRKVTRQVPNRQLTRKATRS